MKNTTNIRKPKKTGHVKMFKGGRVCKKYKCKQRLSNYNSGEYCHVHQRESSK